MKKNVLLFLGIIGFISFTFADYSYQNGSVCVGDICSTETCSVTEYEEQEITTTTEYPDGDISSDLYDYLISQGETTFANWLAGTVCISENAYSETITEVKRPDPTEECVWTHPICGNGVIEIDLGEECDKGIATNGSEFGGCSNDCKIMYYCGDGVVNKELGEECDPGHDSEFCEEKTCKFLENVSPDFDFDVWDPISCEADFVGGILLGDSEDKEFGGISMYLDIDCEGDGTYVSLHPTVNSEGVYTAKLNYTDPSSETYLMGTCHVKYGGCNETSLGKVCIDKTGIETLEGACHMGSGSGGSNTGGLLIQNPVDVVTQTTVTSVAGTPQEAIFGSAGDTSIILNPSEGAIMMPQSLENTGGWYMSSKEF